MISRTKSKSVCEAAGNFHQHVEHAPFARGIHGLDERLIAVTQIHAAPGGRRGDDPIRPGPVTDIDGFEGLILGRRYS
jgi:hypothetical protein